MTKPFFIIVLVILSISGCQNSVTKSQTDSEYLISISDSQYVNEFFKIKVNILPGWRITNQNEIDNHIVFKQQERATAGNPFTREEIVQIEAQNPFMLIITPGADLQSTPLIMINNVLLSGPEGDDSVDDYLDGSKERIEKMYGEEYDLKFSAVVERKIGDRKFQSRTTEIKQENAYELNQTIYSSIMDEFFLNIVVNYQDSSDLVKAERQLENIIFE